MRMKIFLLLNQPYPNGYALTKRFHLYAKGLIENNQKVKILIPKPTDTTKKPLNKSTCGIYDNVEYKYFWKHTTRSNSFFIRRLHDFFGVFMTGIFIIKKKPDVVITSSFSNIAYLYWRLITYIFSIKFIKEKNEIDFLRLPTLSKKQTNKAIRNNKWFDGFVFINKQLRDYTNNVLNIKKPSIIVPILVGDYKKKEGKIIKNTILYSGTYVERKDGVITLLKAFSKLVKSNKNLKLIFTGSPKKSPDYAVIMQTIKNNNLHNNIQFTGYLNEMDLQSLVNKSEMLLVTKPDNRQNKYNFPTKLGEYLISGRPVLSTKVGTIGNLFTDKENIFFTKFDADNMANKIQYILDNAESANKVGENGRNFAIENFNYHYHSKRMIEFFKTIKIK